MASFLSALEYPRSDDLMTPRSIVSSTSPAAHKSSHVPLEVAATSNVLGYEARRALIAGNRASEEPNGDMSIASIERGPVDDVGCTRNHSTRFCSDADIQYHEIISRFSPVVISLCQPIDSGSLFEFPLCNQGTPIVECQLAKKDSRSHRHQCSNDVGLISRAKHAD